MKTVVVLGAIVSSVASNMYCDDLQKTYQDNTCCDASPGSFKTIPFMASRSSESVAPWFDQIPHEEPCQLGVYPCANKAPHFNFTKWDEYSFYKIANGAKNHLPHAELCGAFTYCISMALDGWQGIPTWGGPFQHGSYAEDLKHWYRGSVKTLSEGAERTLKTHLFRLMLIYSLTLKFEEVGEAMGGGTLFLTDLFTRDVVTGLGPSETEGLTITPILPKFYESARVVHETTFTPFKVDFGPVCGNVDIQASGGIPELVNDYFEHFVSAVSQVPFTGYAERYMSFMGAPNQYVGWPVFSGTYKDTNDDGVEYDAPLAGFNRLDAYFDSPGVYASLSEPIALDGRRIAGLEKSSAAQVLYAMVARATVYATYQEINTAPLLFSSTVRGRTMIASVSKVLRQVCTLSTTEVSELLSTIGIQLDWGGMLALKSGGEFHLKVAPIDERSTPGGKYKMGVFNYEEETMVKALIKAITCDVYTHRKNTCQISDEGIDLSSTCTFEVDATTQTQIQFMADIYGFGTPGQGTATKY